MALSQVHPSDESPHAVGTELDWGESYAFSLVDAVGGIAMRTRIGVRPNEGIMDVGLDLHLLDGGLASARHVRPQAENTDTLEVEGVRYEMLAPLERWRISYDGPCHALASSRDAGLHEAWHRSRRERLIVDLEFAAEAPAITTSAAPDRFGQAGRLRGEIWLSGDRYSIDVPGLREKSWGAGSASIPTLRRRFWIRFGADGALYVDRRVAEGIDVHTGWLLAGGQSNAIERIELHTENEPDSFFQKSMRLVVTDDSGRSHAIEGEVIHLTPLPIARGSLRALVCDSVARFRWEEREGHGLAEYVHLLDARGEPIAPAEGA